MLLIGLLLECDDKVGQFLVCYCWRVEAAAMRCPYSRVDHCFLLLLGLIFVLFVIGLWRDKGEAL